MIGNLPPELYQELLDALDDKKIITISPLSAARDAFIYRLYLKDGKQLVAKMSKKGGINLEIFMLNYLRDKGGLPVPEIIYSSDSLIIMEYVLSDWERSKKVEENAAELLSKLHMVESDSYGFEKTTSIGPLEQPNPQNDDWVSFFIENRLLYSGNLALQEGKFKKGQMKKLEKLCRKIPDIITKAEISSPRLIHGDLWDGNILSSKSKVIAFIDPAIYYADPEIELAFTTLFNTFGQSFFRKYNEFIKIREGFFEERKDIYNLYALLVHARIYGYSYARRAENIIDKFL